MSETDTISLFKRQTHSNARGVPLRSRTANYDSINAEAAGIILSRPDLYPPGCGLWQWATIVDARLRRRTAVGNQGCLFRREAA